MSTASRRSAATANDHVADKRFSIRLSGLPLQMFERELSRRAAAGELIGRGTVSRLFVHCIVNSLGTDRARGKV